MFMIHWHYIIFIYIHKGLKENDFVVMDSLVENRPARILSTLLLGSTIWYDMGNGNGFLSHSNDGLVFEMIQALGVEISSSLYKGLGPVKYSAIAIDTTQPGNSAVFLGIVASF